MIIFQILRRTPSKLTSKSKQPDSSEGLIVLYDRNVREIIKQQTENIENMKKYVTNLEKDEKLLEEKIRRQSTELERAEKRLKSLTNVRPGFMDEYERMEQELERLYAKYLEKFRNLDYLEHQLDLYSQAEEEKFQESQKALKRMQDRIKDEEMRILRGEEEVSSVEFSWC